MVRIFVNRDKLAEGLRCLERNALKFDLLFAENKVWVCVCCVCARARLKEAVQEQEETESALLVLIFLSGNCFIFLRSRVKLAQGKRFSFVTSVMSFFSTTSLPASH